MKNLMLFSMWLAASAAAVGVAWAGVSVVDHQVVDPPSVAGTSSPTQTSGPTVQDAFDGDPIPTTVEVPASTPVANQTDDPTSDAGSGGSTPTARPVNPTTSTATPSMPSAPVPSTSSANPTSPPRQSTPVPSASASAPQPTPQPTIAVTPRPEPTNPPATQTPSISPTTTPAVTVSPSPASTTQTFTLVGGVAAISFSSSGVEVLWATANPGFDVRIEPESPGIKVEFRAEHHRSRVDAWWSSGPQHSIREEPRD